MKIKANIVDVVMANKMIATMQRYGCSPDDMLRIIQLTRERVNEMKANNLCQVRK